MEASARGARGAGGHTIGVTCEIWPSPANRWIAEEVRTRSFLERLTTLIERGDAYVVLPGGTGTLAELSLVWEMMNKSALSKTVGGRKPLLVMIPYWQPVIECLNQEASLAGSAVAPFDRRPRAMEIVHLMTDVSSVAEHLKRALAGES
jgi:predicted Rossmann-fold nucleotide-binding protein